MDDLGIYRGQKRRTVQLIFSMFCKVYMRCSRVAGVCINIGRICRDTYETFSTEKEWNLMVVSWELQQISTEEWVGHTSMAVKK
jgi:hypothetical protein